MNATGAGTLALHSPAIDGIPSFSEIADERVAPSVCVVHELKYIRCEAASIVNRTTHHRQCTR